MESVYFSNNAKTAFATGQARGVALLAASALAVGEYGPGEIKLAVVGAGDADKRQVQYMVRALLALPHDPEPDHAADALAAAICHVNSRTPARAAAAGADDRARDGHGSPARTATSCVIEVGGMGLRLFMSTSSLSHLPADGDEVTVFTHLHVREDELTLFGFESLDEQELFEKLITVSGVGPKVALSALSVALALRPCRRRRARGRRADRDRPRHREEDGAADHHRAQGQDRRRRARLALGVHGVVPGAEAADALTSMGFSPAEVAVALKGYEGTDEAQAMLQHALRRLGGGA